MLERRTGAPITCRAGLMSHRCLYFENTPAVPKNVTYEVYLEEILRGILNYSLAHGSPASLPSYSFLQLLFRGILCDEE